MLRRHRRLNQFATAGRGTIIARNAGLDRLSFGQEIQPPNRPPIGTLASGARQASASKSLELLAKAT
jgi:hypothetical protein